MLTAPIGRARRSILTMRECRRANRKARARSLASGAARRTGPIGAARAPIVVAIALGPPRAARARIACADCRGIWVILGLVARRQGRARARSLSHPKHPQGGCLAVGSPCGASGRGQLSAPSRSRAPRYAKESEPAKIV